VVCVAAVAVVDARVYLWQLLLLGGDIEPNPGPPSCGVCGKSCGGRGPRCDSCQRWTHLKCSGLERAAFYAKENRSGEGWLGKCCEAGRGDKELEEDQKGPEPEEGQTENSGGEKCVECRGAIRRNQRGVACRTCGERVHGKCTGVSGWLRMKLQSWECRRCGGGRDRALEGGWCKVCRKALRQKVTAMVCRGCGEKAHKKCTGLSRGEMDKGGEWRCKPGCGEGGGDVGETVGEVRGRRVVEGGECGVCAAAFRRGLEAVVCEGCAKPVHKKCTGMKRWQLDRGEEWRCNPCRGDNGVRVEVRTSGPEAGRCDKCKRWRRKGQGLSCHSCRKVVHVKCAREESEGRAGWREGWVCECCRQQQKERQQERQEANQRERIREGAAGRSEGLTILQWNCDHLISRATELEMWMREKAVDVAILQETKLRGEDGEVKVAGYEVVRKDRWRGGSSRFSRGGGVATLVRKGLSFRVVDSGVPREDAVEALCVEVVGESKEVWSVMNVYIPPASTTTGDGRLERLRGSGEGKWVVGGDFNAHHSLWESRGKMDARGRKLVEWADERGLTILNDGSVTWQGRGTGVTSTPDVTLCSEEVAGLVEWEVCTGLGSDHRPILMSGKKEGGGRDSGKRELAWDWRGAKWEEYRREIRERVAAERWEEMGVAEMERIFRLLVLGAAKKWVGRKKRMVGNELMGAEVREEIARRDALKGEEVVDWEEVAKVEESLKKKVREQKEERWRQLLRKGESTAKMWPVVRMAKGGGGRAGATGEVLEDEGRVMVGPREKANGFIRVYERVSRVKVPRGRCKKKEVNRALRKEGPETEDSGEITMEEVRVALEQMDGTKASGPEGLHPRMLKELPEEALEVVRVLFEQSFRKGIVPQKWRVGMIAPLLKAGKEPGKIASYRPVCLTACMGKWLERVVGRRMRWVLETKGGLSEYQAGFREGRGVCDQLLRLSQSVWDGYEERKKTGLVLFDFERAYDRVWHDGLLEKVVGTGVSRTVVRWVQEWLKNRLYWVRVEGVWSKAKRFQQGLPQGSVLSPLLFLVYINDLVGKLADSGVEVSAFADDLAVWKVAKRVESCREGVQRAAKLVEKWCESWLMGLSVNKCSVTLFSLDPKDSEMSGMEVVVRGQQLPKAKTPRFLGVVYDAGMTFRGQVERVVQKGEAGVRLMRCLAGRDWGWRKDLLRATYIAMVRSVLLYGTAAWAPWVAESVWDRVERVQLEAARVIGGTLRSAPREAVLEEAGLRELRREAEEIWGREWVKCRGAGEDSHRRSWGLREVRRRLSRRRDWRSQAKELMEKVLPEEVRLMKRVWGEKPWRSWTGVEWEVDGVKKGSVEENRERAVRRLEGEAEWTIFTDGSAKEGVRDGGAAVVVTSGAVDEPEEVEVLREAAGKVTSSFQAEVKAIRMALEWLEGRQGDWRHAKVASDSQAGLVAVRRAGAGLEDEEVARAAAAGRRLGERGKKVKFVWVAGHCGLTGNEWADGAAKEAAEMEQSGVECMMKSVMKIACKGPGVKVWKHRRCQEVYGNGVERELEKEWTREEAVSMARFRSGHSLELAAYRKRIGVSEDGVCRRCGEADEELEHVWVCVAGEYKRLELGLNGMSDLCCRPREAFTYWRWWRRVRLKP
jgi:ribonuclease HI